MNKLSWNVVRYDFNKKDFVSCNILTKSVVEEIKRSTKNIDNKLDFAEEVKDICMYFFWSRSEWEVVLQEWTSHNPKEKKVDVYDQLLLNWDRFIDYVWDNLGSGGTP